MKLKKTQKQLADAPDDSELQAKVAGFEKELGEAQARLATLTSQAPAAQPAATANAGDELKKLKIDTAIAKAAVKKVEKALKKAEDLNSPELDIIRQQLQDAQKRADDLEKALANPTTVAPSAAPAASAPASDETARNAEHIKKQKIAAALAKAQINKLNKRLADSPQDADSIQLEITAAKQKQQDAEAQLTKLQAQLTPSQDNTQENR